MTQSCLTLFWKTGGNLGFTPSDSHLPNSARPPVHPGVHNIGSHLESNSGPKACKAGAPAPWIVFLAPLLCFLSILVQDLPTVLGGSRK